MPPAAPSPFTVPHFKRWVKDRDLTFEDGSPVRVEAWMEPVLEDLFARVKRGKAMRPRFKEVWLLIPQGNSKTTLMAIVALYGADFSREPWIPLGAAARDQAAILIHQASEFVNRSVPLQDRFQVMNRRIVSRVNGGKGIQVYPADAKTGDGVIPYPFALCDEGHNWRDLRLYNVWRGKLRKRGAQIVMISTAGEPGGIFEKTREKMRNGARKRQRLGRCYLRAEAATSVLHEYAVPSVKLARDVDAVKEANPLSIITRRDLAEDLASLSLDFGEWLRLTCNIAARSSKAAIAEQDWDDADASGEYPEIPRGEPIAAGFDVGWVNDTTAIVPFWMPNADFRLLDEAIVLEPPGSGIMLEGYEIKAAFERLHARNPIHTVVMDMSRANDIAQWLRDEIGCEVIDRGQGNTLQVVEYESFMEGLRIGALRHTGGVQLRQHVMNAIARPVPGDKRVFDRPSTSRSAAYQDVRVIDALKAASMVHASSVAGLGVPEAVPLVAVVGR